MSSDFLHFACAGKMLERGRRVTEPEKIEEL